MIFENTHMKYDNPKGRRQGETKMTPHVGRSKSSPPFAGSNKSMFDEQFVKNCKQKKHLSFWKNVFPFNGAFNAIK